MGTDYIAIKEITDRLTLEEKAKLCSGADSWHTKGIERLGVPSVMMTDGPHGLRKMKSMDLDLEINDSVPATCFPTAAAMASSWDEELNEEMGKLLGEEAASEGISMVLGPGINIKRNPLCGRNFEYYSEDPHLAGKMGAALIRGIQANGVAACCKHFAANSQETLRMTSDSVIDERALQEIYLPAFETAVKEGKAKAVMCSYNKVNGTYASENRYLLSDVLRDRFGFEGIVISDWGAVSDRVKGVNAGLNLEMPYSGGETDTAVLDAAGNGQISLKTLDANTEKLLSFAFEGAEAVKDPKVYDKKAHHEFAVKAAEASCVLLKNTADILPLEKGAKIAVIGDFAVSPRYQGAGSSHVNPNYLETGLDSLKAEGFEIAGYCKGFDRLGKKDTGLLNEAAELSADADFVVMFLGLDEFSEAEGRDRENMKMPENQVKLVEAVAKVNPNIIAVVSAGSPVNMNWDKNAAAVIWTSLGGQGAAKAVSRIISGEVNPSGKMSETIPVVRRDVPCYKYWPGKEATAEYRESIFVGYRYYDTRGVRVRYPFGYGLSYTGFEYKDLKLEDGKVTFTLKNTGKRAGAEVCQVYAGFSDRSKSEVFREKKKLAGFKKIFLEPGEKKTVEISLDEHAFSYWNTNTHSWVSEDGKYTVSVGSSSRDEDQKLYSTISFEGNKGLSPYSRTDIPEYFEADVQNVPDDAFEYILGRPIPESRWDLSAPLEFDTPVAMGKKKRGPLKLLYSGLNLYVETLKKTGSLQKATDMEMAVNIPLRAFSRMTNLLTDAKLRKILDAVNGKKK